jgi:hypothetical protein
LKHGQLIYCTQPYQHAQHVNDRGEVTGLGLSKHYVGDESVYLHTTGGVLVRIPPIAVIEIPLPRCIGLKRSGAVEIHHAAMGG